MKNGLNIILLLFRNGFLLSFRYHHAAFTSFLKITSSSAVAEGPRDALSQLKSCQLLHAQLYKKSHLTRRIALSCCIKISPVGSLD